MKETTQAWLDRAKDDLDTIEQLLDVEHLTNIVAFHAQQAVEKSLKAVIEELQIGFVKTHDLSRLYNLVEPHHILVEDRDMLDRLDEVYIESRYPNQMGLLPYGKPSVEDARDFYVFAENLYKEAKNTLAPQNGDNNNQS